MIKKIYSRKNPGDAIIGKCHWCKRELRRDDPYVVEEYDAIYKRFIHHSPIHKCFEEYCVQERLNKVKEKEEEEKPNPLDEFWKQLGKPDKVTKK